ncbi:hypothetical protein [Mycobacterium colombiense]|nr:hypothetical protein [Mycobacterium colombiense]
MGAVAVGLAVGTAVAIAIVGYHIYQNNKTPVTTGGSDAGGDRPQ